MNNKIGLICVTTILVYYSTIFLWLPKGVIFNSDEIGLFNDVLYRFNGVPPEYSAWPGGAVQFLDYIVVFILVGVKTIMDGPSVSTFTKILAEAMVDPHQYINVFRGLNLLIFVGVLGYILKLIQEQFTTNILLVISGITIVLVSNSTITLYHFTATSESLALSFAILALGLLKFSKNRNRIYFSGLSLGISLSCKITFGILILYAFYLTYTSFKSLKTLIVFTAIVVLSFMFFCPYIWTDTIRVLKSIMGNFSRSGEPIGFNSAITLFVHTVGVLFLFLFFVPIIFLKHKFIWKEFLPCVVCISLIILSISKSSVAFDRYLIPVLVVIFLFIIGCVVEFGESLKQHNKLIYLFLVTCIFQVSFAMRSTSKNIVPKTLYCKEIGKLENFVKNNQNEKSIIAPYALLSNLVKYASKESILEWHNKLLCDKKDLTFFAKAGIDSASYQVLYNSLSDQEIGLAYRLRVYSAYSKGMANMKFYSFNQLQESRYGLIRLDNITINKQKVLIIVESEKIEKVQIGKAYDVVYKGDIYSVLSF